MLTGDYSLESLSNFIQEAYRRYHFNGDRPSPSNSPSSAFVDAKEGLSTFQVHPEIDAAWGDATRIFHEGQIVRGIVTGWNRGGLLVRWNKLQGFVPASQLKEMPVFEGDDARDEKLARWVGEELDLKVIELDRSRNRLVFSERATIWGPKDGDRVLTEIQPGQTRTGFVSNLCDFGAFVDLGGVDGLIHISELSWGRVIHPREILDLGQQVRVYVLSVDRHNRRIALSLKRLQENPWAIVQQKYAVGQMIRATITNVVDFGAFAQIEEGLEGLIHISEMTGQNTGNPAEIVQVGDEVMVRIVRIDGVNHRLGLSMREIGDDDDAISSELYDDLLGQSAQ
ncbi:MAG: 30S ribosomal protein S1 [Anaerolineae bacterium]